MSTIVVSYRRNDTRHITGRIVEHLAREWPSGVRYDIDAMAPGKDFRKDLRQILADCDVLIAVIGENWLVKDENGALSVSEWVEFEIAFALERDITIIPVLIDGAKMPPAGLLPESIKELAYRHAAELDSERDFPIHIGRIIKAIKAVRVEAARALEASDASSSAPIAPPTPAQSFSPPEPRNAGSYEAKGSRDALLTPQIAASETRAKQVPKAPDDAVASSLQQKLADGELRGSNGKFLKWVGLSLAVAVAVGLLGWWHIP